MIKAHPVIGAKILEPIPFLQALIPLVRHPHERYDGTGYPERLTGEGIPLGARILAVADGFEAMTSYRPYSHAVCPAQAATLLIEGMGKQWDAKVVKAFLRVLERDANASEGVKPETGCHRPAGHSILTSHRATRKRATVSEDTRYVWM